MPALMALGISLCAGAAGFSARYDPQSGLKKTRGSVQAYQSPDAGGLSVALQEANGRFWGFAEWPDKELYGFFEGETEKPGHIEAICKPGSSASLRIAFQKDSRDSSIKGSFGDSGTEMLEFSLMRKASRLSLALE
ncbi:MAG: hypothetical protein LLF89_06140, partial [Spirochaetaceae bacterium]|nr:hypothetical protein [Spirochaetaceae bacterium]